MKFKVCKSCKTKKQVDEFYKHNKMADGYLNFCKTCVIKRVRKYWIKNRARLLLKERERMRRRQENPEYRERARKRQQKWRTPEKNRAHHITDRKLKANKPKVCPKCGEEGRIEGHHENYSKPYEVIWCCTGCYHKFRFK